MLLRLSAILLVIVIIYAMFKWFLILCPEVKRLWNLSTYNRLEELKGKVELTEKEEEERKVLAKRISKLKKDDKILETINTFKKQS